MASCTGTIRLGLVQKVTEKGTRQDRTVENGSCLIDNMHTESHQQRLSAVLAMLGGVRQGIYVDSYRLCYLSVCRKVPKNLTRGNDF